MFDPIFGPGNFVRALAVCGLPIELLNPVLLKQKPRADVFEVSGAMFLIEFLLVVVGQYYGTPQLLLS